MAESSLRTTTALLRALSLVLAGVLGAVGNAWAQIPGGADLQDLAKTWLLDASAAAQPSGVAPLRMEIQVGSLDSRLKLAPCAHVEPYLPAGSRLWGRTRVGVRCVDGMVRWNVSLPVTVNAYGPAWVLKTHVPVGTALTQEDVVEQEVNWAEDTNPVLRERSLWLGQAATRLLTTGLTLRQGMVRPAQVFQAGSPVRVLARGPGFEVSSDAQALSAGVVGQVARVRMENGRVTSGVVLDTRTVGIDL